MDRLITLDGLRSALLDCDAFVSFNFFGPVLADQWMRNADPTGTVLVALTFAVPMKLNLYAPVLIRIDLLPGRSHHHGGLTALHKRTRRHPWRAEWGRKRHAIEAVLIRDLIH